MSKLYKDLETAVRADKIRGTIIDQSATVLSASNDHVTISANVFVALGKGNIEEAVGYIASEKEWEQFVEHYKQEAGSCSMYGRIDDLSRVLICISTNLEVLDNAISNQLKANGIDEDRIIETNHSNISAFFVSECARFIVVELAYQVGLSLEEDDEDDDEAEEE